MTNLLQYMLEVNIYLALAYGGYWLLLRRQTFYSANRAYLLASALLCFAIPLVQISFAAPQAPAVTQVLVQEVFTEGLQAAAPTPQPKAVFEPFKALTALYITGTTLGFVLLCAKLYRLLKLIFTSSRQKRDGYTLILMPQTASPFSFMDYLFVADEEQLQPVILKHELVHINQKHSYDILFTELLKIACWFNPAVYLLQNSLKTIHEFEADRLTAGKTEQDNYVDFLIAQACHNSGLSFANHFSEKQLLKSRIMKLYQKRSGSLARLNYLMALPLCAGMLAASSLAFSKDYGLKLELGKTPEKNLTLESITNYSSENKTQSPETNFPAPTVRSDDGKVSRNVGAEFKSIVEPTRTSAKKDSLKKLRLKVTSGNTSAITDRLKLNGAGGKQLVYTAQTLTVKDQKELKQKFGIEVETTSTSNSTTSILVLPPPPPVDPRNPNKIRRPLLPPPPPPVEKTASAKHKSNIPPPPPPVENKDTSGKITRTFKIRRPVLGNVIIGNKPEPVLMFNAKSGTYIRSQLVYIQIDKGTILDHATDGSAKHSANLVYLINGKIYTVEELEKRSAAIMQSGKIQTLFHAEKMICHEVDNKKMLAKYGQIAKNGVWEFENVYWSKI